MRESKCKSGGSNAVVRFAEADRLGGETAKNQARDKKLDREPNSEHVGSSLI